MQHSRSAVVLAIFSVLGGAVGETWANGDMGRGVGRTGSPRGPWIQGVKQMRNKPGMPIFRPVAPPFTRKSVGNPSNTFVLYTVMRSSTQGVRFKIQENVIYASSTRPRIGCGDMILRIKAVLDPTTAGEFRPCHQNLKGEWGIRENGDTWLRVRNIVGVEVLGAPFVHDFKTIAVSEGYVGPYDNFFKAREARTRRDRITTESRPAKDYWNDIDKTSRDMAGKSLKWIDKNGRTQVHFH